MSGKGLASAWMVRGTNTGIADVGNTPLAALRTDSDNRTRLYRLDLETGKATLLGTVGAGKALVGVAVEP